MPCGCIQVSSLECFFELTQKALFYLLSIRVFLRIKGLSFHSVQMNSINQFYITSDAAPGWSLVAAVLWPGKRRRWDKTRSCDMHRVMHINMSKLGRQRKRPTFRVFRRRFFHSTSAFDAVPWPFVCRAEFVTSSKISRRAQAAALFCSATPFSSVCPKLHPVKS